MSTFSKSSRFSKSLSGRNLVADRRGFKTPLLSNDDLEMKSMNVNGSEYSVKLLTSNKSKNNRHIKQMSKSVGNIHDFIDINDCINQFDTIKYAVRDDYLRNYDFKKAKEYQRHNFDDIDSEIAHLNSFKNLGVTWICIFIFCGIQ